MGMHSRGILEIPMPERYVAKSAEERANRSATEHNTNFRASHDTTASANPTSSTSNAGYHYQTATYLNRNRLPSMQHRPVEAKASEAKLLEPVSAKARLTGWLTKTPKIEDPNLNKNQNVPLHDLYSSKLTIDNNPKSASSSKNDKTSFLNKLHSHDPSRETDVKPPFDGKISNDECQTEDTKAMSILDLYSSESFFENDSDSDTGPSGAAADNTLQTKDNFFEGNSPTLDLYSKESLFESDSDSDIVMVKFEDHIDDKGLQVQNTSPKEENNGPVNYINSSESKNAADETPGRETPIPNDDPTDIPPEISFEWKYFAVKMKVVKRKVSSQRRRRNAEQRYPGPVYSRSTRGRGRNLLR